MRTSLSRDEHQSVGSEISPPPYLVFRQGVSFWVEKRPLRDWTVTPQAFNEGCYRTAWIYDTNGSLWQIVHAKFKQTPSLVHTLLPWKQLPVRIEVRPCARPTVAGILVELAAILEAGNSFSENLNHDPADMLKCLRRATTPTELIQYADQSIGVTWGC